VGDSLLLSPVPPLLLPVPPLLLPVPPLLLPVPPLLLPIPPLLLDAGRPGVGVAVPAKDGNTQANVTEINAIPTITLHIRGCVLMAFLKLMTVAS
jgi:hypothetical protein